MGTWELLPILLTFCFMGTDGQIEREFNGDVTIISTEWAAEIEGGKLGAYNKVSGWSWNGKPVYRQKDNLKNKRISEDPENFMFYHKYNTYDAAWIVSPKCDIKRGICDAGLADGSDRLVDKAGLVRMCQNDEDPRCEKPPTSGWQYWDRHDNKWKQDVSVRLLYDYAGPPCAQLEVSYNANVPIDSLLYRKEWKEILGTYYIKGVLSQGRPTYKKDGEQMFLLVAEGWPHWEIARSPYTTRKQVLVQSGKGTLRPEDAGPSITYGINNWRYCSNLKTGCNDPNNGWVDAVTAEQARVTVKCVKDFVWLG